MKHENLASVFGANYIRAMYANAMDGKLTFGDEENGMQTLTLDWDESTMEEVAIRLEVLLAALTRLGRLGTGASIPEDLQEVYETYIKPYPDHGMDREALYDISMKADLNEPLTKAETELLDKHLEWLHAHALIRLPYNRCNPSPMIQRARRYVKLVELQAPAAVVDSEICALAEEMVIYYCLAE